MAFIVSVSVIHLNLSCVDADVSMYCERSQILSNCASMSEACTVKSLIK